MRCLRLASVALLLAGPVAAETGESVFKRATACSNAAARRLAIASDTDPIAVVHAAFLACLEDWRLLNRLSIAARGGAPRSAGLEQAALDVWERLYAESAVDLVKRTRTQAKQPKRAY